MPGGGALLAEPGGRVREVHDDALDQRAERGDDDALARLFHVREHVGGELQVPGVVELAGLKDRTRRRRSVAAALEGHPREGGPGRVAVVAVGDEGDDVVRAELGDGERPRAHGLEVGVGAARRLGPQAVGELRRLDDRRLRADERSVGKGFRDAEGHAHRSRIESLHALHVVVFLALRTPPLGMRAVFPGEDDVLGRHRRCVRPFEAALELPGDGAQILRYAAVFQRGDTLCEPGRHVPVLVVAREGLQDQRCGLYLLGAAREIGVHGRGRLPVDNAQMPVGPARGMRSLRGEENT